MTNRGICASSVRDFLRALDDHHYRLHALMIQQGDELLYADAAAPYTLDTPHRLCSAAKSILSLNVLLAAQEGKLRFDDRRKNAEDIGELIVMLIFGTVLYCTMKRRHLDKILFE